MTTDERLSALAACLLEHGWTVRVVREPSARLGTPHVSATASCCRPTEYQLAPGDNHDVTVYAADPAGHRIVAQTVDIDDAIAAVRLDVANRQQPQRLLGAAR